MSGNQSEKSSFEFRVRGPERKLIADELATFYKVLFGKSPKRYFESSSQPNAPGEKGAAETVEIILKVSGFVASLVTVYQFARHQAAASDDDNTTATMPETDAPPLAALLENWQRLIDWAIDKQKTHPATIIRAVAPGRSVELHAARPEELNAMAGA